MYMQAMIGWLSYSNLEDLSNSQSQAHHINSLDIWWHVVCMVMHVNLNDDLDSFLIGKLHVAHPESPTYLLWIKPYLDFGVIFPWVELPYTLSFSP